MKKETAVEFIEDILNMTINKFNNEKYKVASDTLKSFRDAVIHDAKEIEKEQIIDAYNTSFSLRDKPYATAEKYYNEIYGGEEWLQHLNF